MAEQPRPDDLTTLRAEFAAFRAQQEARNAAQEAAIAAQRAAIARLKRRRLPRRLLPVLMAALLVAVVPLSALAVNPFIDLNANSPHNGNIDLIYNAGITAGCEANARYCPNGTVTREEMASFLARTAGLGTNPPVVNAKLLGGQPASAYLRSGQDIEVQGIRSSQFQLTPLLQVQPGPLPIVRNFTCGGGTIIAFVSGSAYRTGSPGQIGMQVLVTNGIGVPIGIPIFGYTNETNSHKALVSGTLTFSCAPGQYQLQLAELDDAPISTTTDDKDFFSVTILELPFPNIR